MVNVPPSPAAPFILMVWVPETLRRAPGMTAMTGGSLPGRLADAAELPLFSSAMLEVTCLV
jgi:hypothetical protein